MNAEVDNQPKPPTDSAEDSKDAADPTKPLPAELVPPLVMAINEGIRVRRVKEKQLVRERPSSDEQSVAQNDDLADPREPLPPELTPVPVEGTKEAPRPPEEP